MGTEADRADADRTRNKIVTSTSPSFERTLEGRASVSGRNRDMDLKLLVGSGDRIGLFTLPFLVVGLVLNLAYPDLFDVAARLRSCACSRS